MIIENFVIGPFQTNTYLLHCSQTKEGAIIDPAGEDQRVIQYLEDHKIRLKYILLTHGHLDHIGGVAELKKMFNPEILMHQNDFKILKSAPDYATSLGLSAPAVFSQINFVVDSTQISIGKIELKILHTPGHTPGGLCFVSDKTIFAGDTLFAFSIGRTDLPGGNYDHLISSIKQKLFVLHDSCQVLPGHGPATTIGNEKMFNPFLN